MSTCRILLTHTNEHISLTEPLVHAFLGFASTLQYVLNLNADVSCEKAGMARGNIILFSI